jgi:peptidoglycan/xylan/chitin deacetylase (PgdA/CDA1 family)
MKLSKKIAREIVFPIAYKTGIINMVGALSSHSILNILYHGVVKSDSSTFSPTHISDHEFEKHLIYYKKHFDIISMSEAFEMYRNNIIPKRKTITLSFDDGFKNNLDTALPILEKYNAKTTFFVCSICTQDMDVRSLWTEYINCLNYFHKNEVIEIGEYKFKNSFDPAKGAYLSNYIKELNKEQRDAVMNELITRYELKKKIQAIPEEYWKLMTPEELKKFSQSKIVDIGSHGHLHYNLGSISLPDAEYELKTSKALLESAINKPIVSIAYPDGSYTKDVKDKAEFYGFKDQLAVNYRVADDAPDKRILGRYGISCTTTFESNMFAVSRAFSKEGFN